MASPCSTKSITPMSDNTLTAPVSLRRPRIVFLNRSYWPDAEATGQLLTELCEDLADQFDVTVVAGQPNQNPTGCKFVRNGAQIRNNVRIRRVRHTRFPKSFLPGRAVNLLSYLFSASLAVFGMRRPDVAVVETDPPLLCLLGGLLRRCRKTKLVVYLQDIYPDLAVALGKAPQSCVTLALRKLMFGVYRRADRVVVLSRDMKHLLIDAGIPADQIQCIPNWIDTNTVYPVKKDNTFRREQDLDGQFVVMYSGNLGLCQRLETVIEAADRLRQRDDVLFLFVGDGVLKPRLVELAHKKGLSNVRFLPYQPKDRIAQSLSAADLHLVPLDPRIASCLMPSKLYGILACGTPVLAIAPEDCELAELTREHDVGVVVPPGKPEAIADAILRLVDEGWDLAAMGERARQLATQSYDRKRVITQFNAMLTDVLGLQPLVDSELVDAPSTQTDKTAAVAALQSMESDE